MECSSKVFRKLIEGTPGREFYYNDAGNQIANLTQSVIARLKKISPESPEFPRDGYKGDYIAEIATDFATKTNL